MAEGLPYYVRCYNKRKKPWRAFKNSILTPGVRLLLGIAALEAAVLSGRKAGLTGTLLEQAFKVQRIERITLEEEETGRTERGLSVDLKEGSVKLWRTEQNSASMDH